MEKPVCGLHGKIQSIFGQQELFFHRGVGLAGTDGGLPPQLGAGLLKNRIHFPVGVGQHSRDLSPGALQLVFKRKSRLRALARQGLDVLLELGAAGRFGKPDAAAQPGELVFQLAQLDGENFMRHADASFAS